MSDFLLKICETNGVAALLFIVWFLYHKATVAQFNTLLTQANKQVEAQQKNTTDTFELLKGMIEVNLLQNTKLQKIEDLIMSNQFCPYFRKGNKQGDKNND